MVCDMGIIYPTLPTLSMQGHVCACSKLVCDYNAIGMAALITHPRLACRLWLHGYITVQTGRYRSCLHFAPSAV